MYLVKLKNGESAFIRCCFSVYTKNDISQGKNRLEYIKIYIAKGIDFLYVHDIIVIEVRPQKEGENNSKNWQTKDRQSEKRTSVNKALSRRKADA